jgi:AraC-type transcriptional regulator N-terminus
VYLCDPSSFLVSSIDEPAQSQIVEASDKTPLLVMFIRFDMPTVREVLSRNDIPEAKPSSSVRALLSARQQQDSSAPVTGYSICCRTLRTFLFSARSFNARYSTAF